MVERFTDHHVHFVATAASRLSVDATAARSVDDVVAVVAGAPPLDSGWVRAWGYEDFELTERRHPTRADMDRAQPDRPAILHHRTGHAAVLNSAALAEVGRPDHPDGVLFDDHDTLSRVPRLPRADLDRAAGDVARDWAAHGVSAFVDATHTNGLEELELLAGWRAAGVIPQAVTAMVGADRLPSVPGYGSVVGRPSAEVLVGPAKIMPGGRLETLVPAVAMAHRAGYPVAVHVVDIEVLEATLQAIEASPPPAGTRDRIEHNALCLPEQIPRLVSAGVTVVVNPSFLLHRRAKYESELSPPELGWLIRIGSLVRAGVPVRAGSDSPVVPSRPDEMIRAATHHPLAAGESVAKDVAVGLLRP